MRKIRLHLESIAVESFHTTPPHPAEGTAVAHQFSGQPATCGATCARTCWETCPASCDDATCVTCPTCFCETDTCPGGGSGVPCTDATCALVC